MKRVMIAMSGGVDSSVAAYLLKQQGYEVLGGMLKLHSQKDLVNSDTGCCTTQDIEDARKVAQKLDIPFYLFDRQADFAASVVHRFIETYKAGGTPNPCVDCNRSIKFPLMLEEAAHLGCDAVATGHYARTEFDPATGRWQLKKAVDLTKDQSYVLYGLQQEQLAHILFPLGAFTKAQARVIAEEAGLVTAHKSDSQDICFVPDGDYGQFIEAYTGEQFPHGDFITQNGVVLGTHKGMIRYTVGQRKGLGLALPEPMYVVEKRVAQNQVVLGRNADLFSAELNAVQVNLIAFDQIKAPIRVGARVRYKQAETMATVTQTGDCQIHVVFDQPQRAAAPGQAIVLYQNDLVVGGGTIARTASPE